MADLCTEAPGVASPIAGGGAERKHKTSENWQTDCSKCFACLHSYVCQQYEADCWQASTCSVDVARVKIEPIHGEELTQSVISQERGEREGR